MKRVVIKDIFKNQSQYMNEEILICGWIKTSRSSKKMGFIELNDGSQLKNLQVVLEDGVTVNFAEALKENVGAAISVIGRLAETPAAPQPFELKAKAIEVEGHSVPEYPLQKKHHTLEFLRTIPYLRARSNTLGAVFRIRSVASFAIHKFFAENGFVYTHTPIITGSDCEGAGEMFRVTSLNFDALPFDEDGKLNTSKDFFGGRAHLTVSGQLEGECMAMAFGKIYTFGPTFRAENSNTTRHAAEFWMMEPEIAFADLADNMELAESMLKYVVKHVLEHCEQDILFCDEFLEKGLLNRLQLFVSSEIVVATYTEVVDMLQKSEQTFEFPVVWGCDLQTEHERYLTEHLLKKPVFVTNYPKEIKSFYMRLNDDGKTVAAMDLLVPGIGEILGGSQREERLEILLQRMADCGIKDSDYSWYLDLRRFGGTKHAGFGLGFERLIMYLTGISNIRDVLLFPRTVGSVL